MGAVDVLSEVVIGRPRDEVAAYAANPDHAPSWYANIRSIEWKTPRPAGVGTRIAFVARFLGRRLVYTYEIVEFVSGQRLVMRTTEGPFPMETAYAWEAIDAGTTRMTLRNRGFPTGFSVLVSPFMSWMIGRANRKDLALLKNVIESNARESTKN